MSFKDDDMIEVLKLADFRMSKGELSAFFRKPDHRNFKPAGDQVVRNFLQGLVKKLRPDSTRQTASTKKKQPNQTDGHPKPRDKNKPTQEKKANVAASGSSVWGKIEKPKR